MVTKIELEDRFEYLNEKGELHRLDGPAREYNNGSREWYLNGIEYSEDQYHQELIKLKLKRLVEL
jgi:hypothetical protein